MKSIKKILLTACCLLSAAMSYAYDFEVDGLYYNLVSMDEKTVCLTSGTNKYTGDLVVPGSITVEGLTFRVDSIANNACSYCYGLGSVTLSEGIRSIGNQAFFSFDWNHVGSISLPSSLEFIGMCAFECMVPDEVYLADLASWCNITFEDTYYDGNPLDIGYNAYRNFGESVGHIIVNGEWVRNLVIPEGVERINSGAAFKYTNLESVQFPSTMREVTGFEGSRIKSITWGGNEEVIGSMAFLSCKNLKQLTIPASVREMGEYAFNGCDALEQLVFEEGITEIGRGAFGACPSLTEVRLPKSCLSLDMNAFGGCGNMQRIVLDENLTAIGKEAFKGCAKLTQIYVAAPTPPSLDAEAFATTHHVFATLYVPVGRKALYEAADGWKEFAKIVETDNFDELASYYTLHVSATSGGTVKVLDSSLSNAAMELLVKEGQDIVLQFLPEAGHELVSVMINGAEVFDQVEGDTYTIPALGADCNVKVTFAEIATYLTIRSADHGSVSMVTDLGKAYTFAFNPGEGWSIECVTFNGNDVTSELEGNRYTTPAITADSELSIVYRQGPDNAIRSLRSDREVRVSVAYGCLMVDNDGNPATLTVHTTAGALVAQQTLSTGTTTLDLPAGQIYIVKVGDETFKVSM